MKWFSVVELLLVAALAGNPAASAPPGSRPSAYSEFATVTDPATLETLIGSEDYLYLPNGTYRLDNPIVISRSTPLFIHGSNRSSTQLIAQNPGAPLFEIQAGSLVSFANVNLRPTHDFPTVVDARAISMTNTSPVALELLELRFDDSVIEVKGPGAIRFQGTHFTPHGLTTAPIVIDHPLADVLIVGGNISNGGSTP